MAASMSNEIKLAIQQDQMVTDFKEGEIAFNPTYKYDRGTHNFDSSRKQRVPSWTDRILYQHRRCKLKLIEYNSIHGVSFSDHKPVTALFQVCTKRSYQAKDKFTLESEYNHIKRMEEMKASLIQQ